MSVIAAYSVLTMPTHIGFGIAPIGRTKRASSCEESGFDSLDEALRHATSGSTDKWSIVYDRTDERFYYCNFGRIECFKKLDLIFTGDGRC